MYTPLQFLSPSISVLRTTVYRYASMSTDSVYSRHIAGGIPPGNSKSTPEIWQREFSTWAREECQMSRLNRIAIWFCPSLLLTETNYLPKVNRKWRCVSLSRSEPCASLWSELREIAYVWYRQAPRRIQLPTKVKWQKWRLWQTDKRLIYWDFPTFYCETQTFASGWSESVADVTVLVYGYVCL